MPTTFTLDGDELEALDGETVIQAAHRHGREIPHFCYHPKLSVAGSCRICLVKVNGLPKLMPACNLLVTPKMVVETRAEEVQRARRQVLQFILLNHPVDCGICDKAGECMLQDNQHAYGPPESRSIDPKITGRKLYALSPRISLDNERCILCSRCVRFTAEISKSHALGIVDRGAHAFVDRIDGVPFDDPYSDNVIGICPTGALLSRDFLYRSRVWFLDRVRSVCTGCARVCSADVWRPTGSRPVPGAPNKRVALRVTAHKNLAINGPWLCNKGFDMHRWMARDRALEPLVAGRAVAPAEALATARRLLADARRPAAIVTAHASNEELDAFAARFGSRLAVYLRRDHEPAPGEVVEDDLLIRADKNPNTAGVSARFGDVPYDAAAGHDVVLAWGEFRDARGFAGGDAAVIHLASFADAGDRLADVVIPVSTHFERAGTFTNFEGKTNAFDRVFDPPPGVLHAADVFRELAA